RPPPASRPVTLPGPATGSSREPCPHRPPDRDLSTGMPTPVHAAHGTRALDAPAPSTCLPFVLRGRGERPRTPTHPIIWAIPMTEGIKMVIATDTLVWVYLLQHERLAPPCPTDTGARPRAPRSRPLTSEIAPMSTVHRRRSLPPRWVVV